MTTDDVTHLRALLAEQTARAERAEALVERAEVAFHAAIARANQALAANAEMRAVLTEIREWRRAAVGLVPQPKTDAETLGARIDAALLSRTDLGAGMVVVPREVVGSIVDNCELLTNDIRTDPDFAPLRASVARLAALLKKGGG